MRILGLIFAALLGLTAPAVAACPGTSSDCPPFSASVLNLGSAIVGPTGVPLIPPTTMPSGAGLALMTTDALGHTAWTTAGTGSVTQTTVVPANGFSGSVANATSTPAITLSTTVTGLLKGNGAALSAAIAGTDYLAPTSSGANLTNLTWGQIGGTPTTLGGYGIGVTGTGPAVQETSPILVTPNLGTPSAVVLTHATGLPFSTGITGLPTTGTGYGIATIDAIPLGSITPSTVAATTVSATGTINTTAATGYQIGSVNAFRLAGSSGNLDVIAGRLAAPGDTAGGLNVMIGDNSFNSWTANVHEVVGVGTLTGQYVGSGCGATVVNAVTLVGEHAGGYMTCETGDSWFGDDAGRDFDGTGGSTPGANTGAGARAMYAGGGFQIAAFGNGSVQGNSTNMLVGGTATGGSLQFTVTGNFTGSPLTTATITVTNAESNAAIATAIANALDALPVITNSVLTAQAILSVDGTSDGVVVQFPGTQTTGQNIIIAASTNTSGATVTINNGETGSNLIGLGFDGLQGQFLTTGGNLFGVMQGSLQYATSAANDYCIGFNTCHLGTTFTGGIAIGSQAAAKNGTGSNFFVAGHQAAENATTVSQSVIISPAGLNSATSLSQEVIIGEGCMQSISSVGAGNVVLGACDTSFGMSLSGVNNLIAGHNSEVPVPANNGQLSIQNAIMGYGNIGTTTNPSTGEIGLYYFLSTAPAATFVVSDGGGTTAHGTHIGVVQTTPPTITSGTATLDANASDVSGTVTEGTTQTGFVLTFNKQFVTPPHCIASAPALTAVCTDTTLTVTNASASADVISYVVLQ